MTGRSFGKLTVLSYSHTAKGNAWWNCRCECGTEKQIPSQPLLIGSTVTCGCGRESRLGIAASTHGMSWRPAYQSFKAMHLRCYSKTHTGYAGYGGRGIKVCDKWQDFAGFWEDMGPTWAEGLSLDRINNDKDYELSNCRWATPMQQASNRRNNRILETPDGPMTLSQASRHYGLGQKTIIARIARGIPKEEWFGPLARVRRTKKVTS